MRADSPPRRRGATAPPATTAMRVALARAPRRGPGRAVIRGRAPAVARGPALVLGLVLGLGLALGACGGDDTRTITLARVAPAADPACGAPEDGRTLIITALGDFPASEATARSVEVAAGARLDIASFPPATRVLAVEVIGAGGAIGAVGKTAPLALDALPDGARVPVLMAPPMGACPTGPPLTTRLRPLAARTRDGVLVAGGMDAGGAPVHTVERYDPGTGAFTLVTERLYGTDALGLTGASITGLPDGRVLVAGGPVPAYQVFDPVSGTFSAALFLDPPRAHHAAVALDGARVLLAGGCTTLRDDGACDPDTALRSTSILDLDAGTRTAGPDLTLARIGATAVPEAPGAVLLAGGVDGTGAPLTAAERIDPAGERPAQLIDAMAAAAARLPSGSVLSAFAPAGTTAGAGAAILPAGATAASPVAAATAERSGATLTALEDGRVLALGGATGSDTRPLLYEPIRNRFRPLPIPGLDLRASPDAPAPEHAAVLLADGSVLVLGGRDAAGMPAPGAWILRPELTGPLAGEASASFVDIDFAQLAVPRDPGQGDLVTAGGAHYRMLSSASAGLPSEWIVLAGPRFGRVHIEAVARVTGGGLAVLFGFRSHADHLALILLPGQPASLLHVDAGVARPIAPCDAETIDASELGASGDSARVEVRVDTRAVTASIGGAEVLSCTDLEPVPEGHVGLGVLGTTDVTLRIDTFAASRVAE